MEYTLRKAINSTHISSKKSHTDTLARTMLLFFALVIVTFITTYFTPPIIASIWYILLLVLYYLSDDEPLWLAFFLITVDGFMGFFGLYEVAIKLIPGMPAIEISQLYILLTVVKALQVKSREGVFYTKYLQVLASYVVCLIVWGQMMGLTGGLNVYFRILKTTLPFLLFFSLPRLMSELSSYKRFFGIVFIIVVLALVTQLYTLLTGDHPIGRIRPFVAEASETRDFRVFYNATGTLIGLFGALYFLSIGGKNNFNIWWLLFIVFSAAMLAVISATRGWIISFALIILLSMIAMKSLSPGKIFGFLAVTGIFVFLVFSNDKIRDQLKFSRERLVKLESIGQGDVTAEGSLQRIDKRKPLVVRVWKENRVFGWGFSDTYYKNNDGHIGNQNLLMFSGIVGYILLNGFLLYFIYMLNLAYRRYSGRSRFKSSSLIFITFLVGWFVIHSTSGQQFSFNALPLQVFPQAVFLSLGAMHLNGSFKNSRSKYV
jgi:hypothetical protein